MKIKGTKVNSLSLFFIVLFALTCILSFSWMICVLGIVIAVSDYFDWVSRHYGKNADEIFQEMSFDLERPAENQGEFYDNLRNLEYQTNRFIKDNKKSVNHTIAYKYSWVVYAIIFGVWELFKAFDPTLEKYFWIHIIIGTLFTIFGILSFFFTTQGAGKTLEERKKSEHKLIKLTQFVMSVKKGNLFDPNAKLEDIGEPNDSLKLDEETKKILLAREKFSKEYAKAKGWDFSNLTFEQLDEIRSQNNWKNPNL